MTELLDTAGVADSPDLYAHAQITAQLENFPEVHWALVPFAPLARETGQGVDATELEAAQAPFRPVGDKGFLGGDAWKLLNREIKVDGARFYHPNAGVLYPALYDLLDRMQAAAKAVRPFPQLEQTGYRCSLCGEREWLTTDRDQLALPPGERKERKTLWTVIAERKPVLGAQGRTPLRSVHAQAAVADAVCPAKSKTCSIRTCGAMSFPPIRWRWRRALESGCIGRLAHPLPRSGRGQAGGADGSALPRRLAIRLPRKIAR